MKDENKTKRQLMDELAGLRGRVTELEATETERRQAEEALLTAAQQWRSTFDAIGDPVCLRDVDGMILRCNAPLKACPHHGLILGMHQRLHLFRCKGRQLLNSVPADLGESLVG